MSSAYKPTKHMFDDNEFIRLAEVDDTTRKPEY